MPLVVLLRGVNVGGHRRFRPSVLAAELAHLDVVNLGAAGTFVVRRRVARARLRDEIARRLPFETEIVIRDGREIAALAAREPFAGRAERADLVRFVAVLARAPRSAPALPMRLPADGEWRVELLAREGPFVVGHHRRRMKAIGELRALDRLFGAPATVRGWRTIEAIVEAVGGATR